MRAKNSKNYLLSRVESSSLFQMYSEAFEKVTNYRLSLRETANDDENVLSSMPLIAGVGKKFYLVARFLGDGDSLGIEDEATVRGLLDIFSVQLEDEVNAVMVSLTGTEPHALKRAKQYIDERIYEKVSLSEVASAIDVCAFQLCRLFKAHTGITMTEYISRKRVQAAKRRLRETNQQISEVAREVGFTSLSQFNRNFLKYVGIAPTQFRDRSKELEYCEVGCI